MNRQIRRLAHRHRLTQQAIIEAPLFHPVEPIQHGQRADAWGDATKSQRIDLMGIAQPVELSWFDELVPDMNVARNKRCGTQSLCDLDYGDPASQRAIDSIKEKWPPGLSTRLASSIALETSSTCSRTS